MKRFHVHMVVPDLEQAIAFYGKLFNQAPNKQRPDYAKWILEAPSVNFAISSNGKQPGLHHLGFQVDNQDALTQLRTAAEEASPNAVLEQPNVSCCYAKSDKHWTIDPTGTPWEHFVTLAEDEESGSDACCGPTDIAHKRKDTSCCMPQGMPDHMRKMMENCCGK